MQGPLVDLVAARYIVLPQNADPPLVPFRSPRLARGIGDETVAVYQNPNALPRAYDLPQIAIEPDPGVRLHRLAAGIDNSLLARPRWVGALVSGVTLAAVAVMLVSTGRRGENR